MHKNRSVDVHRFAMIPKADVPRSSFRIQKAHKTTFDAGYLVPIYLDEVLPGDTFNVRMTAFCRLSTPLFPSMDNLHLESFFFFVPNRLVWRNWVRMMGEQANPTDTTSYTVPQCFTPAGGYPVGSLQDHMGLPTVGQVQPGLSLAHSAMWLRAYNLIWNEWFRDENLQEPVTFDRTSDGPDPAGNYTLLRRGKRKDYFTGALPWPQKGDPVTLPLGTEAPVVLRVPPLNNMGFVQGDGVSPSSGAISAGSGGALTAGAQSAWLQPNGNLLADLSAATSATINQLRQSFAVQRLLERDARGGTRYTELLRAHFGVFPQDSRLQRPEFLGSGSSPVTLSPIAQTSATAAQPGDTPLGTLGAMGTSVHAGHGFSQSFTEHGMVVGLVMVRADLTYQQGLRKMWSRKTKYDYYWPAFSHLGEQAILNKEIYCDGSAADEEVFGYQERWAEYRYNPSEITGLFRSTASGTLDAWHYAQKFAAVPSLNATFIEERPPLERTLAVGAAANGQQFICDTFFETIAARPMPMYSVPGLIDHF